ncbi:MAG: hypothetical protein J7M29_12205 [Verrucomicrobia bacterium]|nr:hypothetical protein [Verrucomicrobiota bacterium]
MRKAWLCFLLLALAAPAGVEAAASGRILKVLKFYVDAKGRHARSPSLYQRDAYQAWLRQHPEARGGLRICVHWAANREAQKEGLRLRAELITANSSKAKPIVVERAVRRGFLGRKWDALELLGKPYRKAGRLIAWRVTLWSGKKLLAEERSFLW